MTRQWVQPLPGSRRRTRTSGATNLGIKKTKASKRKVAATNAASKPYLHGPRARPLLQLLSQAANRTLCSPHTALRAFAAVGYSNRRASIGQAKQSCNSQNDNGQASRRRPKSHPARVGGRCGRGRQRRRGNHEMNNGSSLPPRRRKCACSPGI